MAGEVMFFKPKDFNDFERVWDTEWTIQISDHCNRLLRERGTVVYGRMDEDGADDFCNDIVGDNDTHTGLIICIEPIEKDTAESLLRAFVAEWEKSDGFSEWQSKLERAKKLLEGK